MMEKMYNFTQDQLKVLLMGRGYNKIAGLNIVGATLENEPALVAIHEMSKSQIICSDGEKFDIKEDVRQIVDCLGNSQGYMLMHSNSMTLPDKCLFLADKVLTCTSRVSDSSHICVGFSEYDELFDSVFDEGYLPLNVSELVIEDSVLEEYEREIFSDIDPNKALPVSSSILFSLEELSSDEKMYRYLRVIDYYFYTYIAYFDGEKICREMYTPDSVKMYFEKMINI